jgi:hypothetical protein
MRDVIISGAFGLGFGLSVGTAAVVGQTIPKSLQEGGPEEILKQRQNNWTVGIAGGNMDGTYLRFADELGKVLDDGDELRVLPTISRGAAANLQDLLYLRGIDVAFTQSDVFEYFRTQRKTPNLEITGRRTATDTVGSNGSSNICLTAGTNSPSRLSIRDGATST